MRRPPLTVNTHVSRPELSHAPGQADPNFSHGGQWLPATHATNFPIRFQSRRDPLRLPCRGSEQPLTCKVGVVQAWADQVTPERGDELRAYLLRDSGAADNPDKPGVGMGKVRGWQAGHPQSVRSARQFRAARDPSRTCGLRYACPDPSGHPERHDNDQGCAAFAERP